MEPSFMGVVATVLHLLFSLAAFNWKTWTDTSGVFLVFWVPFALLMIAGMLFYALAFYLNLRDNLPRNVKTKNSTWLFLFTLYFFEVAVMNALFWMLWFILTFWAKAGICRGDVCTGTLSGLWFFLATSSSLSMLVLYRTRKSLGIPLLDAFGL